ncbi:putative integral membrane protein, Mpv17/PMP22 family [Penicillium brasilianum]|uniref:Putative integral membrane protein, Mpv17/PMP22 family n=1 Tax=Penicillium brasilianum TaxID=104259 RepID=A0A1S9RYI4_PENBI|nr:putative integral membrane protein, Mpv17/PMP22 family [Penicillium brasilianum]
MSLFQRGLGAQASAFATRPRPINPSIRAPLRRVRQPRRHKSSDTPTTPETPAESKVGGDGVTANAPPRNTPSNASSPSPAGIVNTAAAVTAAGAATAPDAANAVMRSRGLREIIRAGPLGQLGRWYARVQERKPYATQICSSIVVYLCGDLSAQLLFPSEAPPPAKSTEEDAKALENGDDKEVSRGGGYDPWRTVRHLIVGASSSIPSYNWFMFIHNHFNFSSRLLSVLTKVVVQQICFTPVFNTYFFSVHSLLSGATLEETWERLKKALPVSVTNSAKLWPAVTAFSIIYIPAQFRNVFAGVIAVGWQTYLSWLNQKAAREVLVEENEAMSVQAMAGNLVPATSAA